MGFLPTNKSVVGRLLRFPLRAIQPGWRMPVLMSKARGKRWVVGSGNHGHWIGWHDLRARRVFEKMVTPGSVVYDVGSYVGFYTLLASILVGPRGKVFAFEPCLRNLSFLKEHLRINHIANVTVIEAAVGEQSGTVSFFREGNPSLSHPSDEGDVRVRMVSLDDFIRKEGAPQPDLVKVDVVGSETGVLKGAKALLTGRQPVLFMHIHSFDLNPSWIAMLQERGYDLMPIGHEGFGTPGGVLARKTS